LFQQIKPAPKRGCSPVTQACFFGLEGPANRSADVMPSTVRPGRFLDDAVPIGNVQNSTLAATNSARCWSVTRAEIDARPPRIAYNASGVDQWAFRPVIGSGCVKRSLVSAWIGHGNGRQQRWIGRNAGRCGPSNSTARAGVSHELDGWFHATGRVEVDGSRSRSGRSRGHRRVREGGFDPNHGHDSGPVPAPIPTSTPAPRRFCLRSCVRPPTRTSGGAAHWSHSGIGEHSS
jgi:hypothetical protein